MSDLKNDALEILERAKEKAAPIVEDVKDKAAELREKAEPVIGKVKSAAEDAIDAVKDGAEKIGNLFEADAPAVDVKNELFSELEQQVQAGKDAAQAKAQEMQALLEKMMGKK